MERPSTPPVAASKAPPKSSVSLQKRQQYQSKKDRRIAAAKSPLGTLTSSPSLSLKPTPTKSTPTMATLPSTTPVRAPFMLATELPGATPLSTQLPTPIEISGFRDPISKEGSEMPIFTAGDVITSLPAPIEATKSNIKTPPIRMVPVCKDFRRYADYVKKHFPEEINSRAVYFITMIAVIQTINDIYSSILLGPEEWLKKLGTTKYKKYMPTIVDLQIIWSFTLGILDETPYAEYVTLRNNALEGTKEAFEDALINYMETESIASLKEDKSTSSVSSSIYKLKPPPYTRHSPIVQGDAASLQSNKSDKSRKSQKHTSSRGYHTTTPNPINSQGEALCSLSKHAKKNNGSIQSNDDMDEVCF